MTWFAKLALATKILVVPVVFLIALGIISMVSLSAIDQQQAALDRQRVAFDQQLRALLDQQRKVVERQRAAVENLGNVQVEALADIAEVSDALTRAQLSLHNLMTTAVNEYDSDKIKARFQDADAKLEAVVPAFAALDFSGIKNVDLGRLRTDAIAHASAYQAAAFAAADMAPLDVGSAGIILNDATRLYEVLAGDVNMMNREVEGMRIAAAEPAGTTEIAEATFVGAEKPLQRFLETAAAVGGVGLIVILLVCGRIIGRVVKMAGSIATLAAGKVDLEKTISRHREEIGRMAKDLEAAREKSAEAKVDPSVPENGHTDKASDAGTVEADQAEFAEAGPRSPAQSMPGSAISLYGGTSTDISGDANGEISRSEEDFKDLVDAAVRNHEVIEFISEIAEQANLRALNATLEAARSGDKGEGYAVLAAEAKHIAEQAPDVIGECTSPIIAMRSATSDAFETAQSIRGIIGRIKDISETMTGVSQTRYPFEDLTKAVSETGDAAREVLEVAIDLSEHAQTLNDQVDSVLTKGQAA
jgi:methyl-accepting chemotaxis protein